jgi:aminopeptidase YwaD
MKTIAPFLLTLASLAPLPAQDRHIGPDTPTGSTGPARFVGPMLASFDREKAMEHIAFTDRFYREPGNDGFEAVVDRVLTTLRAHGFGEKEHLALEVIETRDAPGWSPVRATLSVLDEQGEATTLLAFGPDDDRNRTMLPTGAPGGTVEGRAVFDPDDVEEGTILITGSPPGFIARRVKAAGGIAILSARISGYNRDTSGKDRHLDAIIYGRVRGGNDLMVGQISLRVHDKLRALAKEGPVRLRFEAEVKKTPRKLRTVVATFVGHSEPNTVVPIAGHIQEPGAVDNASGVGGLLEAVCALTRAIDSGEIPRPRRSVAFVWGNEMEQSRVYLDHTKRTAIAAISADMIGASRAQTGAWPLLERDPDPGAQTLLPPDEHTPWGAGRVRDGMIHPNGLSLIARLALRDVARAVGGWETREHPWEGGSDHDIFIRSGVPAVLLWCFTDFAYHTSLDRLSHVDPEVTRRMATVIVATALSIADPADGDLDRYRAAVELDRKLRVGAAEGVENESLVLDWKKWFEGVDAWLVEHLSPDQSR